MAININHDGGRSAASGIAKIITFNEADDLGPFELVHVWADRPFWPVDQTAEGEPNSHACPRSPAG